MPTCLLFLSFCPIPRVSYSPGWLQAHCGVEGNLELPIFLILANVISVWHKLELSKSGGTSNEEMPP